MDFYKTIDRVQHDLFVTETKKASAQFLYSKLVFQPFKGTTAKS